MHGWHIDNEGGHILCVDKIFEEILNEHKEINLLITNLKSLKLKCQYHSTSYYNKLANISNAAKNWHFKSQNKNRIDNMLDLASYMPGIHKCGKDFDETGKRLI